ncbi:MAG TPA: neocarzinostatin apoprotein domain-containing protein, partial [Acidimicrobiales bacterium]|nr:neocarzinostatin apoprotein domain-containing protein [Acidimicrobiales bacterium]
MPSQRRTAGRLIAAVVTTALALTSATPAASSASPAAASAFARATTGTSVHVSPSSGIHSGAEVTVSVTGEPAGTTMLAIECYSALALQDNEDACENGSNAVFWAPAKAAAVAHLRVFSTVTTAVGQLKCGCLVAVVTLADGNSVGIVGIVPVSFAGPVAGTGHGPPAPPVWASPPGVPTGQIVTPAHPLTELLKAGEAQSLDDPGSVTGPGVTLPPDPATAKPVTGVALLQLVLASPGTSWANASDTAAVVDVKVSTGPTQQIVLFAGARPFTYAAEFGDLPTGHHEVTVAVSKSLSTTGKATPEVRVIAERLSVVTPGNPAYLEMQYAPVVYGRPDSATSDTPLF